MPVPVQGGAVSPSGNMNVCVKTCFANNAINRFCWSAALTLTPTHKQKCLTYWTLDDKQPAGQLAACNAVLTVFFSIAI